MENIGWSMSHLCINLNLKANHRKTRIIIGMRAVHRFHYDPPVDILHFSLTNIFRFGVFSSDLEGESKCLIPWFDWDQSLFCKRRWTSFNVICILFAFLYIRL